MFSKAKTQIKLLSIASHQTQRSGAAKHTKCCGGQVAGTFLKQSLLVVGVPAVLHLAELIGSTRKHFFFFFWDAHKLAARVWSLNWPHETPTCCWCLFSSNAKQYLGKANPFADRTTCCQTLEAKNWTFTKKHLEKTLLQSC